MPDTPTCPICAEPMELNEVRNSLSRYIDRYICNRCGAMEAMFGLAKMHPDGRECLWFEEVHGDLALVNEKINGFKKLASVAPGNVEFVRRYIDAVNNRMGHTDQEVLEIISNSMFIAELTWTPREDH